MSHQIFILGIAGKMTLKSNFLVMSEITFSLAFIVKNNFPGTTDLVWQKSLIEIRERRYLNYKRSFLSFFDSV